MGKDPRRASHAGSWYEADPGRLGRYVAQTLSDADAALTDNGKTSLPNRAIRALIGPHAGIRYCGETSSHAYASLRHWLYSGDARASKLQRVFLLGPSHHKWVEGIAVSTASAYETPFGSHPIDVDAIADVASRCKSAGIRCSALDLAADEEEHSLELHLPFLSHVLHNPPASAKDSKPLAPSVKVVPILVGGVSSKDEGALGRVFSQYYGKPENLFVISSDFCHWGSRFRYTYHFEKSANPNIGDSIEAMDREGARLIAERDVSGWASYLKETGNTICGRAPISALLWAMDSHEKERPGEAASKVKFLHYSQSSRCKSAGDSSVSYASFVVEEQ